MDEEATDETEERNGMSGDREHRGDQEPRRRTRDRVGFEPTVPLRVHRFSRPAVSTAHAPVRTTRRSDAEMHRRVVNKQGVTVSPRPDLRVNPKPPRPRITWSIPAPLDP